MPEINYWGWFHINGISLAHRGFSYTNYSLQQNTTINDVTQKLLINIGLVARKPVFGVLTKLNSNQSAQLQRLAKYLTCLYMG